MNEIDITDPKLELLLFNIDNSTYIDNDIMVLSKILSHTHDYDIIKYIYILEKIICALTTFFRKLNARIQESFTKNKNNDFFKINCFGKISCHAIMLTLFSQIFKNINNVSELVIQNLIYHLMYTQTGHDIMNIFINYRKSFTENETMAIFRTVLSSNSIEINNMISSFVLTNIDKLYCSIELMEYASFIPIVQYVELNINNINITKEIFNNIILYSNNVKLCEYIVENYAKYIDEECMILCLKSRNKHIILLFYNLKIQNNYNIEKMLEPIEFDNAGNIVLYTERHKYMNANINILLKRTIGTKDYCSDKQLKKIFNL